MNVAVPVVGLPPVDQIGLIVVDLERALARYAPLFGPFTQLEARFERALYRGRSASCRLAFAFGRSGPLEIKLVQWLEGDCPHRDFIAGGQEGLHHLRVRSASLPDTLQQLAGCGYTPLWSWSEMNIAKTALAYVSRPGDPLCLEVLQQVSP